MSNYTDGKKALSVGDFSKAEAKLLKALDNRPDDGELWWALMLCKNKFRNDDELVASLRSEFAAAARDGGAVPSTPFDSAYCKNALRFESGSKRKDFVSSLTAELSEIWAEERGTPLKLKPVKKVKSARSSSAIGGRAELYRLLTYIFVGISAIGGVLAVYSIFALARWALWSGFIIFLAAAVLTIVFRRLTTRAGGSARAALSAIIGIFAAVCVGLFIAGVMRGNREVMIFSASVFGIIVIASLFNVSYKVFAAKSAARGKAQHGNRSRDPVSLAADADNVSKDRLRSQSSDKRMSKVKDNEYKDDYD